MRTRYLTGKIRAFVILLSVIQVKNRDRSKNKIATKKSVGFSFPSFRLISKRFIVTINHEKSVGF